MTLKYFLKCDREPLDIKEKIRETSRINKLFSISALF